MSKKKNHNFTQKSTKIDPAEVTMVKPPFKVLLDWKAPSRPFKKRNREFFTTIASIVFLLTIILLFLKEWLLIGAIISLSFVTYVIASIPPEEIEYKITTRGISIAKNNYQWLILGRYWFSKKWERPLLHIEHSGLPPRLTLVYDQKQTSQQKIKEILDRYLIFEKPELSPVEKAAKWLEKKVPLEKEAKINSSAGK